jgi:hypothetical protein
MLYQDKQMFLTTSGGPIPFRRFASRSSKKVRLKGGHLDVDSLLDSDNPSAILYSSEKVQEDAEVSCKYQLNIF